VGGLKIRVSLAQLQSCSLPFPDRQPPPADDDLCRLAHRADVAAGVRWHTDAIRVPSARMKHGDKRADRRGRVPDDIWEFPRVCGNYAERRQWAVTQHPEALIERLVRMSCRPGI
jgi:hypothetical protein